MVIMKLFLFLFILLQSCTFLQKKMYEGLPMLEQIMKDETMEEIVKMGLFDGCFTAYHARATSFYKTTMYFRQNPDLVTDDRYAFAWSRGYGTCFPEANTWTHMQLGGKFINTGHAGSMISPVGKSVQMPIGNDAESKPAVWYFDEDPNRGLPGVSNYGTGNNFFGVFGSCYLC